MSNRTSLYENSDLNLIRARDNVVVFLDLYVVAFPHPIVYSFAW